MGRILAIDYGLKRTGLAVSDPLRIIASGLTTIASSELIPFLKNYVSTETVDLIIVGLPVNWDESATHGTGPSLKIIEKIRKEFPAIPVQDVDERFTSKLAKKAMVEMNLKKKDRRDKSKVDQIAATIMLQDFMLANG